jgi:hypothetical protein
MSLEPSYNIVSPDLKKRLDIHDNQHKAANDIIDCFLYGIKEVLLTAPMQSGKSGTIRCLLHKLLCCEPPYEWDKKDWVNDFRVDATYFICGMNDNDLRQQAISELHGILPASQILFSKQLQKHVRKESALVIVDESHYAANRHSLVDKFLFLEKPQYIVSISATAMAEIATSQAMAKGVVHLVPSKGYYSISDIFARGLVRQAYHLSSTDLRLFFDMVSQEVEDQRKNNRCCYNLVRLASRWHFRELEQQLKELDLGINFINTHSDPNHIKGEFGVTTSTVDFSVAPISPTIVWIFGSLRAGKQLETKHLGFVHDTAHSRPDTVAQSLLGRLLGYNKHNHQVVCYTDLKSALLVKEWIEGLYDPSRIPTGSKGIRYGYCHSNRGSYQLHPPLGVELDRNVALNYRSLKQYHGNRYPYKWDLLEILSKIGGAEWDRIINSYDPGRNGGLMILTEDNKSKNYYDHWIHNHQCLVLNRPTRGFDAVIGESEIGLFQIYINLNLRSSHFGLALLTYKEPLCNNEPRAAPHVAVKKHSRFSGEPIPV